ncbi:hypothetical protein Shpa_44 [Paracoccus phage Shpa]|uniref:Uncharacterized protein n=1 Tax=Paracoccus phage Shpa TaxID=1647282 RepID=A0A0U2BX28_9CAUD|nr:hypothetical protein FDG85_gp44 [Paracoccus phage Shpa]AKG94555.1 hypothetical protein Shpa_44 [Paracoccus phage Shpa]
MTPILDRIRAHGGEAIRDGWTIRLRPGRLSPAALEWLRGRKDELTQEVWPEFDAWVERAAIMEFDAGMSRQEAERAAYREVMGC